MKVMLVNGSPHKAGAVNRALEEISTELSKQGVDSEIFWIGSKPVGGCMGCGGCNAKGECVYDDAVNEFRTKAAGADGFVFGGAVHYAHAAGSLLGFMDRLFYSNGRGGQPNLFAHKPAAAVTSARRGGTTSALDDIQKFFGISQMPIVTSRYWNMVHGNNAEQAAQDEEGMWTMRQLARNMAWMLKCIEAGKAAGIELPGQEAGAQTNFIR